MAYQSSISGAFNPTGNTITFLANTVSPTAVQALSNNVTSYCQYRIFNSGGSLVFLGIGANSTIANNNANVVSTTGNCIPILPGSLEVISFPCNAYFTGMTSSGNSQIYVTPGYGV